LPQRFNSLYWQFRQSEEGGSAKPATSALFVSIYTKMPNNSSAFREGMKILSAVGTTQLYFGAAALCEVGGLRKYSALWSA
jgi:hypothetical protein